MSEKLASEYTYGMSGVEDKTTHPITSEDMRADILRLLCIERDDDEPVPRRPEQHARLLALVRWLAENFSSLDDYAKRELLHTVAIPLCHDLGVAVAPNPLDGPVCRACNGTGRPWDGT